jgi:hypothetical protein
MKIVSFLLVWPLLALLIVACVGGESEAPGTVEGPALIMFYTDG